MNKGNISPIVLFGLLVLLIGGIVFASGFQLPSFNWGMLSLKHIFCGGFSGPPIWDWLNPSTWFSSIGYAACTTALPVLAAVVFSVILVVWVLSVFPQLTGYPPVLLVPAIIGLVVGFIISNFVLDMWWLLLLLGGIIFVIKLKVK